MSTVDEFFDPKRLRDFWSAAEGEGAPGENGDAAGKKAPVEALLVFERFVLSLGRDLGPAVGRLEHSITRARKLLREQFGVAEPVAPGEATDAVSEKKTPAPPRPLEGKALAKNREELGEVLDTVEDLYEALLVKTPMRFATNERTKA